MPSLRALSGSLLLVVAVLLAYGGVYDAPLVFDDEHTVTAAAGGDLLRAMGEGPTRALPQLSFALNRALGGSLAGYHALNVGVHLLNALLVLGLLRAMVRLRNPDLPRWAPLAGALLWALHPLHTSAVTYLSQRAASLAALCYLAAAFCYLRAREDAIAAKGSSRPRAVVWYLGALAAAVLAAGAKENTATLPGAILLLEWLVVGPRAGESAARRLGLALPFIITPALQGAFVLGLMSRVGQAMEAAPAGSLASPGALPAASFYGYLGVYQGWDFPTAGEYLLTEAGVLLRYLKLWLLPVNQVLDPFVLPVERASDPRFLAPAAALLIFLGAALTQARRRPWVTLGVLWFFLTIAVESSVIPIADFMFEHRMLVPSLGLTIAALGLAGPWLGRRPSAGLALLAAAAFALGLGTFARNRVWESPEALWSDNVSKAPRKLRGWVNLSHVYEMNDQLELAEEALLRANAVFDRSAEVHFNLGVVRMRKGQMAAAEESLRRALALNPLYAEAHYNLGTLLAQTGRDEESEAAFRWVLQIKETYVPEARYNLGVLFLKQGRPGEAAAELEGARAGLDRLPQLHLALAQAYRQLGRDEEARREAAIAERLRNVARRAR
ncbi:MAG: tetratricopeptide repeat protein [Deltaproteobacteria bacterium]|nr:tetratricopeptide repeat protein [Deltaproteobacteria bacterium]